MEIMKIMKIIKIIINNIPKIKYKIISKHLTKKL